MSNTQTKITEFANNHDLTPGATVGLINHVFGLITNIGMNNYLKLPQAEQVEFIKNATTKYVSSA